MVLNHDVLVVQLGNVTGERLNLVDVARLDAHHLIGNIAIELLAPAVVCIIEMAVVSASANLLEVNLFIRNVRLLR